MSRNQVLPWLGLTVAFAYIAAITASPVRTVFSQAAPGGDASVLARAQ